MSTGMCDPEHSLCLSEVVSLSVHPIQLFYHWQGFHGDFQSLLLRAQTAGWQEINSQLGLAKLFKGNSLSSLTQGE